VTDSLLSIAQGAQLTQSERKRAAILTAALSVFMQGGYLAASMDEIAERAQVAKQTVYKQFTDKATLFRHVVATTIEPLHASFANLLADNEIGADLEAHLQRLARQLVAIVTSAEVIQLRRVIMAETDRFTDVTRQWYELGPRQTITTLSAHLTELAAAGHLVVDNPERAAEQFLWLAVSIPLNRLMFSPSGTTFPQDEANEHADDSVRVFLAAYRQ
jgi:TetR/AcrR family transcriptional regulator, mexJK operon transcriptional repressor